MVRTGGFEPLNPGSIPGSANIVRSLYSKGCITRMSELVKETGLRSVGLHRMGSNPIPSIAERHIRYSLAVRIGLFHSLDPGSTPGIGTKFVFSLKKHW